MPKITKKSYRISGEFVTLETWYNTKKGFYLKNPPEGVLNLGQFKNGGYTSEEKLGLSFHSALKQYHEAAKISRKVIRISCYVGRLMQWKKSPSGGMSRMANAANLPTLEANHGIGLNYEILMRVDSEQTRYHRLGENGEVLRTHYTASSNDTDIREVDYTEEAEAYLENLKSMLDSLAGKAIEFFNCEGLPDRLTSGESLLVLPESKNND